MKGRLSDVDVKLLRVFTRVVEHGGFSAAQAELGISQASISTYMSDLEARLGVAGATNFGSPIHRALESFLSRENDVSLTLHVYPPNELESGVLEGRFELAVGAFYQ